MKKKLSFIIPAFNAEDCIKRCVEKILLLDDDIEVIVIDDGSSDGTAEILSTFRDSRFRFCSLPHYGVSRARNAGIEEASGEYICFVDADDVILPNSFLRTMHSMSNEIDLLMYGYQVVDGDKTVNCLPCLESGIYDGLIAKKLAKRMLDPYFAKKYKASYIGGKVYQYLIRKSILEQHQNIRFDASLPFAEDMCFLTALLQHVKRLQVNNQICYSYLINSNSAAHRYRPNYWRELSSVYKNICKQNILNEESRAKLYCRYVKEALLHYASGSISSAETKKNYAEIIKGTTFAWAVERTGYNDWTKFEHFENMLISNHMPALLYYVEQLKVWKHRFEERNNRYA